MDTIFKAEGGGNLSTPQKIIATLLSIVLVVGLSPFGQVPQSAYAAQPTNGSVQQATNSVAKLVSQEGTFYYTTLASAISDGAAATNSTVSLLNNIEQTEAITVTGPVTIDLAGKTLTLKSAGKLSFTNGTSAITGTGTIAITGVEDAISATNSTTELSITNATITSDKQVVSAANGATVTSTGTTYSVTQAASDTDSNAKGVVLVNGGTFNMPSGSITTNKASGSATGNAGVEVYTDAASVATLGAEGSASGPTITSFQAAVKAAPSADNATVLTTSKVTIYGGTYNATYTTSASDAVAVSALYAGEGSNIIVNGGTITGKSYAATTITATTGLTNLTINGGTLSATSAGLNLVANTALVKGGTISTSTIEAHGTSADNGIAGFIAGGSFNAKPTNGTPATTGGTNTVNQFAAGYTNNAATAAPYGVLKDMSQATVTTKDVTFTGAAQTPETIVTWPGSEDALVAGTDYTVLYYTGLNTAGTDVTGTGSATVANAGTYYAKVTPVSTTEWTGSVIGPKNEAGTAIVGFTVGKPDISKDATTGESIASVYLSADGTTWTEASQYTAAWTGQTIEPQVELRIGSTVIRRIQSVSGTNYTNYAITYSNNSNVAAADAGDNAPTVTITVPDTSYALATGKTLAVNFGITATQSIGEVSFTSATTTTVQFDSNGNVQAQPLPAPRVANAAGTILANNTDYTYTVVGPDGNEATQATNAGVYTYTITGKASRGYSEASDAAKTATFTVNAIDISDATKGKFTLPTAAPSADTAAGPFTETTSGYSIAYSAVVGKTIVPTAPTTYTAGTGTSVQTIPGTALTYTVNPSKIATSGTQTITIGGYNNFTGSQTISVAVSASKFTKLTLTAPSVPYSYTGEVIVPDDSALNFYNGDVADVNKLTGLVKGTDYTVEYLDSTGAVVEPINAGTYTVSVTGINGFAGSSATATYTINSAAISSVVTTNTVSFAYNNSAKNAFVFTGADYTTADVTTVKTKTGETLVYGTDYTILPETIAKSGTIYLYGMNLYSGALAVDVSFSNAVLSETAEITATPSDLVYNFGAELKPTFTLTNTATQGALVAGADYTVTYQKATYDEDGTTVKSWSDATSANPTAAGHYKATFTGAGNYASIDTAIVGDDPKLYAEFDIAAYNLSNVTFPAADKVSIANLTFNGKEQNPTVLDKVTSSASSQEVAGLTVTYTDTKGEEKSYQLANSTDFTTTGYTDAGDYKATIEGTGNFQGTFASEYEFSIAQLSDMTNVAIQFENASGVYTDSYIGTVGSEPAIRVILPVTDSDPYVFASSEYAVVYSGNQTVGDADAAQVTVTFNGTGNVVKNADVSHDYTISSQTLANAELKLGKTTDTYTSTGYDFDAIAPSIVDKSSKAAIANAAFVVYKDSATEGTAFKSDSDPLKDVGTYKIVGYCTSGYSGTVEATFTITQADISKQSIVYNGTAYDEQTIEIAYNAGKAIEPAFTVGTLVKDTDYTVEYANNINAGDATATITGTGNYTGSVEIPFTITKVAFSSLFTIYKVDGSTGEKSYAYTGSALQPKVVVTDTFETGSAPTMQLTEGIDYELTYSNNVYFGTATVYAVPVSENYTGTASAHFEIKRVDLTSSDYNIATTFEAATYTGEALTPKLTVTYTAADGTVNTLAQGTDYTTPLYSNNIEVGDDAQAMIVGLGNYTGTLKPTFSITKGDLSKAVVTLSGSSFVYNGKAQTPTVEKVTLEGDELDASAYTVTVASGTNVGTYYASITAKDTDHFTGSNDQAASYKITQAASKLTAKAKSKKAVSVKAGKTIAYSKYLKIKKSASNAKLTFKKTSGSKKITINPSTGKLKVNKKLAKKTYTVKLQVKETSTNYKTKTVKNISVKIKVK